MVHCTSCGKPIERIPDWMSSIQTEFVCNNCPNRTMKNIAFVTLEPIVKPVADEDEVVVEAADEEAGEEDEA